MSEDILNRYGGLVYGQVYFWNEYLEDKTYYWDLSSSEIGNGDQKPTYDEVYKQFIENGWNYVWEKIRDRDMERADYEEDDFDYRGGGSSSSYCEACHENPCMCSDREKSSTVWDF